MSFFGQSQYSDWKIILSFFLIAFLISIFLALFLYFYSDEGVDLYGQGQTTTIGKKIKKEALEKVIIKMEERQKNFEELKVNKPTVGDPSI